MSSLKKTASGAEIDGKGDDITLRDYTLIKCKLTNLTVINCKLYDCKAIDCNFIQCEVTNCDIFGGTMQN